ncbi:MAG: hypothetical protein HQL53_11195, partial [Magnetococcales bacterium]|nr:hypothetical protein [Magnetococcales bacterium]
MAITVNDLKLYKAVDQSDNATGGGPRGAEIVVDNQVGNLFGNITRLARASGETQARKVYHTVTAAGDDHHQGVFAFIEQPPADDNVTVSL